MKSRNSALILSDGSFYLGEGFGADLPAYGELVFNTSMTGYQEALTDPSYAGQVLTFAYPLVGNYGISGHDFESSKIHPSAVVVREWCENPVHRESAKTLSEFLAEYEVPGISGVDTRAIVTKIRSAGVMPAAVLPMPDPSNDIRKFVENSVKEIGRFDYAHTDFVRKVTRDGICTFEPAGACKHSVVLVDCGVKSSIVRELNRRSCKVTVVPADTEAGTILSLEPDGVVYSNGPGDPALMGYAIESCREILGKVPVFGICLGHQILGHALGAKTYKLKFGHRGSNHPVLDSESGKAFITSQNHGYAVRDLPSGVTEWLVNLNDSSNEGLLCADKNAMSVQFHPEASPGPHDTGFLFDEFAKML